MLGSSQSITGPNIALNTIMAEELEQFADILEKAEDFSAALHDLIRNTFREHKRIIFNGNGYEQAWVEEAERRGLSNLTCTADALKVYLQPKHIELFRKHGVFTEEELTARNEIHWRTTARWWASRPGPWWTWSAGIFSPPSPAIPPRWPGPSPASGP